LKGIAGRAGIGLGVAISKGEALEELDGFPDDAGASLSLMDDCVVEEPTSGDKVSRGDDTPESGNGRDAVSFDEPLSAIGPIERVFLSRSFFSFSLSVLRGRPKPTERLILRPIFAQPLSSCFCNFSIDFNADEEVRAELFSVGVDSVSPNSTCRSSGEMTFTRT
jgi:hypothetical protein